ncbi:MAG TPA: protease inhibitor I42 family protein [Candidatus Binatia bacterium]|nr:protease inhibitor I42 family protein [Candidatus Binatia bacterium]
MKKQIHAIGIAMLIGLCALAVVSETGKEEAMAVFPMSAKGETCVTVKSGQFFSLKFLTSPGTGYGWMLAAEIDEKLLAIREMTTEAPDTGLLGASEYETWHCQALKAGQTKIVLKYVRPWEKDVAALKTHVFLVHIQ